MQFVKNNKLILKSQQRFRWEKHNVFTEKVSKIALSSNGDKRMQSINSLEIYANGTSTGLTFRKEEINCNSIINQYKNNELW